MDAHIDTGIYIFFEASVVSGLVPRWVAKPPQSDRRRVSGELRAWIWGGFATQRGTSPLTKSCVDTYAYR